VISDSDVNRLEFGRGRDMLDNIPKLLGWVFLMSCTAFALLTVVLTVVAAPPAAIGRGCTSPTTGSGFVVPRRMRARCCLLQAVLNP